MLLKAICITHVSIQLYDTADNVNNTFPPFAAASPSSVASSSKSIPPAPSSAYSTRLYIAARYLICMPPAEGKGNNPKTSMIPTNGHLAHVARSEQGPEIIVGNIPPTFMHVVLCGELDSVHCPALFSTP